MVRPKGSRENIDIAVDFAKIFVVQIQVEDHQKQQKQPVLIRCKGRKSLFAAFASCMPHLARDSKEKRPKNRQGVSAIELNKGLLLNGLKAMRLQKGMEDGQIFKPNDKVWELCRWSDPSSPEDAQVLAEKLAAIQGKHAECKDCSVQQLHEAIERILSQEDESETEQQRDSSDGENESAEQDATVKIENPELQSTLQPPMMFEHPPLQVQLSHASLVPPWLPSNGFHTSHGSIGMLVQPNLSVLLAQATREWASQASSFAGASAEQRLPPLVPHSEAPAAWSSDGRQHEVDALRSQVRTLEQEIAQASLQERNALRMLPALLTERSTLLAENTRLVTELSGLRSENAELVAEVLRLRAHRTWRP